MTRHLFSLVFFVFAVNLCAYQDLGESLPEAIPKPLLRILAAPHEFVGQPITVAGIFSWGHEDELLFLTYDHFAMYDHSSAIRLALDKAGSGILYSDLQPFRGHRVKLDGVLLEVKHDKALVESAEKAGYIVNPLYYFRFSRLRSYGSANEAGKESNKPPEPTDTKDLVSP